MSVKRLWSTSFPQANKEQGAACHQSVRRWTEVLVWENIYATFDDRGEMKVLTADRKTLKSRGHDRINLNILKQCILVIWLWTDYYSDFIGTDQTQVSTHVSFYKWGSYPLSTSACLVHFRLFSNSQPCDVWPTANV